MEDALVIFHPSPCSVYEVSEMSLVDKQNEKINLARKIVYTSVDDDYSASQLMRSVEDAGIGFWYYNITENYSVWDTRASQIFGSKVPRKIRFDTIASLLHPQDQAAAFRDVKRCLDPSNDGIYDAQYRIVGLDDRVPRWIRCNGRVQFQVNSEKRVATEAYGIVQDISKHMNLQIQSIENQNIFDFISNSEEIGTWKFNLETFELSYTSKILEHILGKTNDDDPKNKCALLSKLVHPNDQHKLQYFLNNREVHQNIDFEMRIKNGDQYCWLWIKGGRNTLNAYDDNIVLGIVSDITKKKQNNEKLRFLNQLEVITRDAKSSSDIMQSISKSIVDHLGVMGCLYASVESDENSFFNYEDAIYTRPDYPKSKRKFLLGPQKISDYGERGHRLLKSGEKVIINDVSREVNDQGGIENHKQINVSASIACPHIVNGKIVALMVILNDSPRHWTPYEIDLIEDVIKRSWAYIERKNYEKALIANERSLEIEAQKLEKLNTLGKEIAENLSLSTIVKKSVDALGKMANADHAFLIYTEPSETVADSKVHCAYGPDQADEAFLKSLAKESLSGLLAAIKNRKIVAYKDSASKLDLLHIKILEFAKKHKISAESILIMPISFRNGKTEDAAILFSDKRNAFKQAEKKLVQTACSHIGLSIENARLYIKTQDALEEANRANTAKTDFLANMSHELRTPLNAIVGISDVIGATKKGDDVDFNKLKNILKYSAESLLDLINSLLDISKIEQREFSLESKEFDFVNVIRETCALFEDSVLNKGLKLNVDLADFENYLCLGDKTRMRQIFMNIIGNAVKFTKEGQISVRAKKIQTSDTDIPLSVVVEVEDTGIGIPKELCEDLFKKFQRGYNASHIQGTGLGLVITRHLVNAMGGEVHLESQIGKGTKVSVSFPEHKFFLNTKKSERPVTDTEIISEFPEKRILVVEDNHTNVIVMRVLLEKFKIKPTFAKDAFEAFRKLEAQTFDLVFMDINMPYMDGITATRKWRTHEEKKSLPRTTVVGLTAYARDVDKKNCMLAGMDDHLAKPVALASLGAMLRKHLSN